MMKKTFKNFTLYVTKKDDTIESIAKKFGCEVDDIYRFNKMIRYHNIFPGMPLHIAIPSEERVLEIEKKDTFAPIHAYDNIWYYRSTLIAYLYSPFSADIIKEQEKKNLHALFSSLSNQSSNKIQLESFISYLHDSNYVLAQCIEKNAISVLKNEMERKKQKCLEYKKYLLTLHSSNDWSSIVEDLLTVDMNWQTFILKYASKKAKEGETLFQQNMEKEITLYQKISHFFDNEKKE